MIDRQEVRVLGSATISRKHYGRQSSASHKFADHMTHEDKGKVKVNVDLYSALSWTQLEGANASQVIAIDVLPCLLY